MRFEVTLCLILLTACDSPPKLARQAQPAVIAKDVLGGGADIGLTSKSGLRATLTYKFEGNKAPKAVFTGADGSDVTLADFAGRPLLVNIWATWCAPCKAEMPTLDALAEREQRRISVIAVSQDLQGRMPVQAFFDTASIANLEPYTDPGNALLTAFGNNVALPTTILYDADSREVWRIVGGVEWDDTEISKLLNEAAL